MNKAEYMARLRELLSDITEAEREEALNYYEDYFDDAGAENEASVIKSLGSPEKVAATIKDGLNDHDGESGEFRETGYHTGAYENKAEVVASASRGGNQRIGKRNGLSGGGLILVLILCIFALPILVPVTVGIGSALLGILCAAAALLFALLIAGVAITIAGIALLVAGIVSLIEVPIAGILLLGIGLILGGVGVLLAVLGIWVVTKVVPPLLRGFVNLCRKPFKR